MTSIPARAFLIAMFVHTLWGANPVAIKFGLLAFPPVWSAFIRFTIGAACVAAWARFNGIRVLPRPGEWRYLVLCSLLFAVQVGLMNIGIDNTTGAVASVLVATYPLFTAVLAHFFIERDRMTGGKALGLAVAFVGAALVLLRGAPPEAVSGWGAWVVLGSAGLLAVRLTVTANLVHRIEPTRIILWQSLLALPLFAAFGGTFETIAWDHVDWRPLAGLAYQGIVIAGMGFMVTTHLLKCYSPSVMVSFGFISPVAGVLLSIAMLAEAPTVALFVGLSAVGLGLFLIARRGASRVLEQAGE